MIIGITGKLGCGKDTVADILVEKYNYIHLSLSDMLREDLKKQNKAITRENLIALGKQERELFGGAILAERITSKLIAQGIDKNFVITSIGRPEEVDCLNELPDFISVFVEAPPKVRFLRISKRLRGDEKYKSYKEFLVIDKKESKGKDNLRAGDILKKKSKIILNNDKTLKILEKKIDLLIKNLNKKDSWDQYFLKITEKISERSNCLPIHVGAIVVKGKVILSTGYNGAPRKTKDCVERGYCLRRKLNIPSGTRFELCTSVHAEQNAIINASRQGMSLVDGTMYLFGKKVYRGDNKRVSIFPCFICKKMIINAGIKEVVCSTEDGNSVKFKVDDWVEEWKTKEIIDDKIKYETDYTKK
jgi:dCMP deaminase